MASRSTVLIGYGYGYTYSSQSMVGMSLIICVIQYIVATCIQVYTRVNTKAMKNAQITCKVFRVFTFRVKIYLRTKIPKYLIQSPLLLVALAVAVVHLGARKRALDDYSLCKIKRKS